MSGISDGFYRFRSVKALLGPFDEALGQYDELGRQEIFFAHPRELNDPMEGFKDVFWQGDKIAWHNLLVHYLYCLMQSAYLVGLTGKDFTASMCDHIVRQTPSDLPEAPIREIYKEICDRFFAYQVARDVSSRLSERTTAVRRDGLTYCLRSLNPAALSLVHSALMRRIAEPDGAADTEQGQRFAQTALYHLAELLKVLPDDQNMGDAMFTVGELHIMQLNLIHAFNTKVPPELASWMFLVRNFPDYYVASLERLVHPDWHAACFVADATDPSMWGSYGDGHRGVCLKFAEGPTGSGQQSVHLYRATGWSGDKNGIVPHYTYAPHPFEEVRYTHEFPQMNFFSSIGTLSMPRLMTH
jgi:hypothetical protein